MIGNDIVDLDLSRKQSNWKRKGFLNKIFTLKEQELIHNDSDPELMVWNLWSRKESAYKIYNRCTGIKGYFPLLMECCSDKKHGHRVSIKNFIFYTQTQIEDDYIYSIAVSEMALFDKVKHLETIENVKKENGIPYILDISTNTIQPVSITHHGLYQKIITL